MPETLERRVIALERRVSEIEGQLGFLLPTLRQVHLDLLGFKEETAANFADVHRSLASLDGKFDALTGEVGNLGGRADSLDRRLGAVDRKFDALDSKFDALPRVLAEMLDERQKRKS